MMRTLPSRLRRPHMVGLAAVLLVVLFWPRSQIHLSRRESKPNFYLEGTGGRAEAGQGLTIWTILRDFHEDSKSREDLITQSEWLEMLHTFNALNAWARLEIDQVIIFGSRASCELAMTLVTTSVPDMVCLPIPCVNAEFNVPTYDCLFAQAAELSTSEFLMYSNSDMVYFSDLLAAAQAVSKDYQDFLMVGQRHDISLPRKIDFDDAEWPVKLRDFALTNGELHGKYGVDYFLYRRSLARKLPPFLVGRVRWDNWLLGQYIGGKDSVAVDATKAVVAVHLNHMKVGNSHSRTGTEYNVKLATTYPVKLVGDIESADLALHPVDRRRPACPNCVIKRVEQPLDTVLAKYSTNRNLIIATVNLGYLDFALNWMCSLRRVGVDNFMFHAADRGMYERLLAMNLPVFYYESSLAVGFRDKHSFDMSSVDYGSVAYQALMNTRTEFVYKVLQKGYSVFLCDVDVVFLQDPFPHFNQSLDIQGGMHKKEKITGGYVYIRPTDAARQLWIKLLLQHRDLFQKIQNMTTFNPHSMTEQELINLLIVKAKPGSIAWGFVDEKLVADGKRFFMDKLTQKNGEWPVAVHNNFIVGRDNKHERFVNTSLWFVTPELTCKPFPAFKHEPPRGRFQLTLKVLAFDRPQALARLFASLDAVDFQGDTVNMEIFIDLPDEADSTDMQLVARRKEVVAMAEAYAWTHGRKRVVPRTEHFGLARQWLSSWFPSSDSEICTFLEDDNVVSPVFYDWLKRAANVYYYDRANYDPRRFGISMQQQHMIAGHYPKKPSEFLPKGSQFYQYQLLSTWGPTFFPHHWGEFLAWYSERSSDEKFLPLFSNMITNDWFLKRGGGRSVWSAWFMRFAAERGYYALYTNFADNHALVVNYRDKGVNFKEDKGPNSNAIERLAPEMVDFPKRPPIYDFHFNLVADPNILEGRALYVDTHNVQTH